MDIIIERLTPYKGVTKKKAWDTGEYELIEEASYNDLYEALQGLRDLIDEYTDSEFDLRIDGVIFMTTEDGKIIIE